MTESELNDISEKKQDLFDAMGVMQHHDAVTGCEKQAVADDYDRRLNKSVEVSGETYASIIGERASQAGLDDSLEWSKCTTSVNAPIDCKLTDSKDLKWMIAAHNPSTIDHRYVRLSAPYSAAYKVFVIDENQEWKWTPTDMLCFGATENDEAAEEYQTCELYVMVDVPAQGQAHIKVEPCDEDD